MSVCDHARSQYSRNLNSLSYKPRMAKPVWHRTDFLAPHQSQVRLDMAISPLGPAWRVTNLPNVRGVHRLFKALPGAKWEGNYWIFKEDPTAHIRSLINGNSAIFAPSEQR